jgi:glycosyltransferase involved in cell wall biosynthesis
MADDGVELTILMPCLNEARTLETCIQKARGFAQRAAVHAEIVVADNGSTDGSQEIAERAGARVVNVPLKGYGAALYYGTVAARGRFVIMGDSDDSYDFSKLDPFVDKLREGYDLVMGNRFAGGIAKGAMPWKNRWIGNPAITGIGRRFFHCPANDFLCGLRGFSADAFKRMDLRTTGMEYASEMVVKATLRGMKIAEVPTTLTPDGRGRKPHLRPWRDGWRYLRFMLMYSPRWLFLIPGMIAICAGLLLGGWLWNGPKRIGGIALDVHTLLYAAAFVLIGFQAVVFAIFTKIFAILEGLLPPDPRLDRLFKYVTLEVGLAVGFALVLAGIASSIGAVYLWSAKDFGPIYDQRASLRIVIFSVLSLTLGFEIILSSFFVSILGLRIRRLEETSR